MNTNERSIKKNDPAEEMRASSGLSDTFRRFPALCRNLAAVWFRASILCLGMVSIWPLPAWALETTTGDGNTRTELWEGKVLTARFRAGMCFAKDGAARGVLILRHSNGKEDVYHLYGRIEGNEFALSHSSGHHFTGEITSHDSIKGSVRLKNGMRFSLSGNRQTGMPLIAEDCAPLPDSNTGRP